MNRKAITTWIIVSFMALGAGYIMMPLSPDPVIAFWLYFGGLLS